MATCTLVEVLRCRASLRKPIFRCYSFNSNQSLENDQPIPLSDNFGRFHNYLRISLTEKCNFRCTYCMPENGVQLSPSSHLLNADEILNLARIFVQMGVTKIRLTGGEPTLRKDLLDIIRRLNELRNLQTIAMTSNGLALHRSLSLLVDAGLSQLNLSLDTLQEQKFEFITRRKGWKNVWRCLEVSEKIFNPLKVNCVVMKGLNDDEICDFVSLTEKKNIDVRFIEYMPFDGNKWNQNTLVPFKIMLSSITEKFGPLEPTCREPNQTSTGYRVPNFVGQIGFITSMTNHFCRSCNRLRLTADGNLKVCLFGNNEVSLRDALRNNVDETELMSLISQSIKRKHGQHAGLEVLSKLPNRPMVKIGG